MGKKFFYRNFTQVPTTVTWNASDVSEKYLEVLAAGKVPNIPLLLLTEIEQALPAQFFLLQLLNVLEAPFPIYLQGFLLPEIFQAENHSRSIPMLGEIFYLQEGQALDQLLQELALVTLPVIIEDEIPKETELAEVIIDMRKLPFQVQYQFPVQENQLVIRNMTEQEFFRLPVSPKISLAYEQELLRLQLYGFQLHQFRNQYTLPALRNLELLEIPGSAWSFLTEISLPILPAYFLERWISENFSVPEGILFAVLMTVRPVPKNATRYSSEMRLLSHLFENFDIEDPGTIMGINGKEIARLVKQTILQLQNANIEISEFSSHLIGHLPDVQEVAKKYFRNFLFTFDQTLLAYHGNDGEIYYLNDDYPRTSYPTACIAFQVQDHILQLVLDL